MVVPETYKYVNLIKKSTPYALRMKYLSNKIFVDVPRPTTDKSLRVIKMFSEEMKYKQDQYINYYPRYTELGYLFQYLRDYGLFRDEHMDFKEEMTRLRALRGIVKRPYGSAPKKTKHLLDTK